MGRSPSSARKIEAGPGAAVRFHHRTGTRPLTGMRFKFGADGCLRATAVAAGPASFRPPDLVHQDGAGPFEDGGRDGGEELREGQGLDAQFGEAGEVGCEGGAFERGGVHGADGVAIVHQVEPVVGAALEAEARGAFGEVEGGGWEVGEVRVVEVDAGRSFAEAVDGSGGWAVAPEAGDAPGLFVRSAL